MRRCICTYICVQSRARRGRAKGSKTGWYRVRIGYRVGLLLVLGCGTPSDGRRRAEPQSRWTSPPRQQAFPAGRSSPLRPRVLGASSVVALLKKSRFSWRRSLMGASQFQVVSGWKKAVARGVRGAGGQLYPRRDRRPAVERRRRLVRREEGTYLRRYLRYLSLQAELCR